MELRNNDYRKKHVDILLSDERYLKELRAIHKEMSKKRCFRKRLDEIEKELSRYIGNEKNMFVPDYVSFDSYAYEHYFPKEEDSNVCSKYMTLLGENRSEDIPGCFYCIILIVHLHDELELFLKLHENEFESLSKSKILDFENLHSKFKLLYRFLMKIDNVVAAVVASIDMEATEYLDDDIKSLDAIAVKNRFMHALQLRDKSMSFKLLGRMRELDEGEDYYFEALAHYINEDYQEAIRYVDKVEKNNIDYNSAIALKLECFSKMGDSSGFFECIYANIELTFNFWHFDYLLMILVLTADSNVISGPSSEDIINNIKLDFNHDEYYMNQLFSLVTDIIIEGISIIEEWEVVSKVIGESDIPKKTSQRFMQLSLALSCFPNDLSKYLDLDYIIGKSACELKREVEPKLLRFLIDENPFQSFEKTKEALLCQLKLGDTYGFLKNVSKNFDVLVQFSERGEVGADELLRIAYIEGTVIGKLDEKIAERIESTGTVDLSHNITDKKIYNFLSEQGRLAYEAAEWQFAKSQEEDYGWRDAGMISLSFYRILEVELNRQFIIPLLSKIGYSRLNNEYKKRLNTLSKENKNKYIKKWETILNTYHTMENDGWSGNGFMLGVLNRFFRAIGSEYDATDPLGTLIRENLGTVLNSYGIEQFDNGFFEAVTNRDTINKYRNPPAHTRYLPYEIACECREVFRKTILQLNDMLK